MLASFESFLQTAKATLKTDAEEIDDTFDGQEQTDDPDERHGVDVSAVNGLARDHYRTFGREMAHPKMDALVDELGSVWESGRKGLVFVRRVASVDNLTRKLNETYDRALMARLRRALPDRHHPAVAGAFSAYRAERARSPHASNGGPEQASGPNGDDLGANDTFFAWFFRGGGPDGMVSGATVQDRLRRRSGALATFFDDNHVMAILDAQPGTVLSRLAAALGWDEKKARHEVAEGSRAYLTDAVEQPRGALFDAAQAAALELLSHQAGPFQSAAAIVGREVYPGRRTTPAPAHATADHLETRTFFTELRQYPELRRALWPEQVGSGVDGFRAQYLRAQMLSACARLGHAFIDLYTTIASVLPTLEGSAAADLDSDVIGDYLDLLSAQASTLEGERDWSAYDELSALAEHFDLVLDANAPELRRLPLADVPGAVARLFRAQRPVGGMAGQVNQQLVRQFRLPGYPLILVCTDLLQEGEDLHTFCSHIYHYGLAWTPSATEQRIGRIDRVRSLTERRLTRLDRSPEGQHLLQVYYPHLVDTVERLQVRRVLRRVDEFVRLMHTDLGRRPDGDGHVDISRELLAGEGPPSPAAIALETAFPVRPEHLYGEDRPLAVDATAAQTMIDRFSALAEQDLPTVKVTWEPTFGAADVLLATAQLPSGRVQPFSLHIGWATDHLVVRCVSPIGLLTEGRRWEALVASSAAEPVRLGAVRMRQDRTYDVTVEDDLLLTDSGSDAARVAALIERVTGHADALEHQHLPDRDRRLDEFRTDLKKDVRHER